MTNNVYDRGDKVRLSVTFTNITGTVADPTAIVLRVKAPDATVTVYNYPADITRASVGAYYYDISITETGDYYYRWEGTGTVQAAGETLLRVRKSKVIT